MIQIVNDSEKNKTVNEVSEYKTYAFNKARNNYGKTVQDYGLIVWSDIHNSYDILVYTNDINSNYTLNTEGYKRINSAINKLLEKGYKVYEFDTPKEAFAFLSEYI